MSYQVSLGLFQDITRITTINQSFLLKFESYNHSVMNSPTLSLDHPSFDHQYAFLASKKQVIDIYLCSLADEQFMKVAAYGKLDLRSWAAMKGESKSFQGKLILYSMYNNEVIMHFRCQYRQEIRSRNEGLKPTKFPKSRQVGSNRDEKKRIFKYQNNNQNNKQVFFKGACENRNFFSFLDPVYKGQSYQFMEPSKK